MCGVAVIIAWGVVWDDFWWGWVVVGCLTPCRNSLAVVERMLYKARWRTGALQANGHKAKQ